MAISIKYGDELLTSVEGGQTATLNTENKILEKNLTISVPSGEAATIPWGQVDEKPNFKNLAFKDLVEKIDLGTELISLLTELCEVANTVANNKSSVFIGSENQYNDAYSAGDIPTGTIVVITKQDIDQKTSAVLGEAILGWLKLGQS